MTILDVWKDAIEVFYKTCADTVSAAYLQNPNQSVKPKAANFVADLAIQARKHRNLCAVIYSVGVGPVGFLMAMASSGLAQGAKKGIARKPADHENVHLDLICSEKGTGSSLMRAFLNYVNAQGLGSVTLDAIANVLFYYQQFGFSFRRTCAQVAVQLPVDLVDKARALKKHPKTSDEALKSKVYKDAVKFLHERGLSAYTVSPCDDVGLSIQNIISNDCNAIGYCMARCP